MASNKDSIQNVIKVALLVCLACAIVVSTAAVVLRPIQQQNQQADLRRNVLQIADMYQAGVPVDQQFEQIETRLVDLQTGTFSDEYDIESFDPRSAPNDPEMSSSIPSGEDIAGLKRRERYTEVYIVNGEDGAMQTLILPVRGYGLWSTMWGFIALEDDLNTVVGFGFYDQEETPGLGGEVDNPRWKSQFPGKLVYNEAGDVQLELKKGGINPNNETDATYRVDALSGATLTSRGVTNLIQYWMGERGFKPFLNNLKAGEA